MRVLFFNYMDKVIFNRVVDEAKGKMGGNMQASELLCKVPES